MEHILTDRWGSRICAENEGAVRLLDGAVEQLVSLSGDPATLAGEAALLDRQLVLAPVLQAYLALYAGSAAGVQRARDLLDDHCLPDGSTGEREALHVRAARAWVDGEWERAAQFLERALAHEPRDLLALKIAQDLAFFSGDQRALRDVVARVVEAWPPDRPGHGYVCGMYAFGCEENGQYDAAEEHAQKALEENPRDVWAVHAQAHVFEMKGDPRRGIAFLEGSVADWSSSYFATHNWWHRALYHLELREVDAALGLYDGPIRGTGSREWLDLDDAASLLWRVHLFGVDVGPRARALLGDVPLPLDEPVSAFNDWHAVMVAGLAGAPDLCEQIIQANRHASTGTNRRALEAAGLQLMEGFAAFAAGEAGRALRLLADTGPKAHVVGGSHAQRDVIGLTLMAAASRSGDDRLAESLLAARLRRKPSAEAAGLALIRSNRRG